MRDATAQSEAVEIHLEELGHRSWLAAAANTLLGNAGSAQFRFAARPAVTGTPPGEDASVTADADPVLIGATFPVMRWQDLANRTLPHAWLELAGDRLDEIDGELRRSGWARTSALGRHWWSRRYVRSAGASEVTS